MLKKIGKLVFGGMCVMVASSAFAASWPDRPIRFIVPFPAGGSTDAFVRALLPQLRDELGQTVVVEYKAGAGGAIGADAVAKAAPDGYTIGLGSPGALMVSPSLTKTPYDTAKDFSYVSGIARVPAVLVVTQKSDIKTVAQLVERAKAKPGSVTYAHAGQGTLVHLVGELFSATAGIKLGPVPYRGAAPAVQGLMSGDTDILVADLSSVWTMIKAGQLTALAITSKDRLPALPNVPTVAESGYAKATYESEYGAIAPAGVPPAILAKLKAAMSKTLASEAVRTSYATYGAATLDTTSAQYRDAIVSGARQWGAFVKERGITAE